jgi:hypothetical protein
MHNPGIKTTTDTLDMLRVLADRIEAIEKAGGAGAAHEA